MNDKLLQIFAAMALNNITESDLDKAIEDNLDIIGTIISEAETDNENESDRLLEFYKACNSSERAIIDLVLMYICGWRMKTIIDKSEPMEEW